MDQHLSWYQHLKMLKQKLRTANGLLAKVCYYLPPKLLRTLFTCLYLSHISDMAVKSGDREATII